MSGVNYGLCMATLGDISVGCGSCIVVVLGIILFVFVWGCLTVLLGPHIEDMMGL